MEKRARQRHFCIFSCYIEQATFIIDGNQILFIYPHPIEIHAHRSLCPMTLCPHADTHKPSRVICFAIDFMQFCNNNSKISCVFMVIESGSNATQARTEEEANGIISIDISAAVNCLLVAIVIGKMLNDRIMQFSMAVWIGLNENPTWNM